MKLRRLFGIFFSLCLVLGLTAPASAAGSEALTLEQAIIDACTYDRDTDLRTYMVTRDELEETFDELYYQGLLPWYTTAEYRYSYNEQTNQINTFEPGTLYDGSLDMAAYEEKAAQILAECVKPGMEQWQIALSIHDYLIANTVYDETMEKNTAYDILVNGTAVCAGYALAYQDLLTRAGIECMYVISEAMEHAWNLVRIDGSWYHVDLTWDDPTPDAAGFVSHDFFLLTDAEISAGDDPHYGWDSAISCTDTRFSDGFWREVYSRICFESSQICYLLRTDDWTSHIYRRNESTGDETRIYKEKVNYIDIGHGEYMYEHQGLSLRGGRLWFNSLDKLLSMKPDGSGLRTEYTNSGNTYIYSSHVSGDTAQLSLLTHDEVRSAHTVSLESAGEHIHSFTQTVTDATCTENGYTTSVCDCGLAAQSTPMKAAGHSYSQTESKAPTLFSDGFASHTCSVCGDNYTEQLSRLDLGDFLADNFRIITLVVIVAASVLRAVLRGKKH